MLTVACNAVTATEVDPVNIVFDGWTQGSWQRVFVSQLDPDTENWVETPPGENWRMDRLSENSARVYGDNGDPFDVSFSTEKYIVTWLDTDEKPTGETEYSVESLNVIAPNDWTLTLKRSGKSGDQFIEMIMFGDLYSFVLWSKVGSTPRRHQWIAVSRRIAD